MTDAAVRALRLEKLWLRPARERLAAALEPVTAEDDAARMTACRERWRAFQEFEFAVIETADDHLVGEVALDELDHAEGSANLSYWIVPGRRSRGYATAAASMAAAFAFRELELRRLWVRVAVGHAAGLAVARKLPTVPVAGAMAMGAGGVLEFALDAGRCAGLCQQLAGSYLLGPHPPGGES